MTSHQLSWTETTDQLSGPAFDAFSHRAGEIQRRGSSSRAFRARLGATTLDEYAQVMRAEGEYIEAVRKRSRRW